MIGNLQRIADECDKACSRHNRVFAKLCHSGVVIIADSRDGERTASFVLDWAQIDVMHPATVPGVVTSVVERL